MIYSLLTPIEIDMIILIGVVILNITEATKQRISELCYERNITYCKLATISGIPYTTIKSIMYNQSKNPGITTIKKICDGLEITITDFFDTDTFRNLEQEIV